MTIEWTDAAVSKFWPAYCAERGGAAGVRAGASAMVDAQGLAPPQPPRDYEELLASQKPAIPPYLTPAGAGDGTTFIVNEVAAISNHEQRIRQLEAQVSYLMQRDVKPARERGA